MAVSCFEEIVNKMREIAADYFLVPSSTVFTSSGS